MQLMSVMVEGTKKLLLGNRLLVLGYVRVEHLIPSDMISKFVVPKLEQLVKARNMSVLEMSPENEVVGEIIFHQHKLLCNVITKKCISDDLTQKVVKSLP